MLIPFLFLRKRTYVGDLSSGDFSTPEKRRKNIGNVKKIIKTQRQKIHSLQTTVGALRKRISTLKSLLTYLKKQAYISEAPESTIRVTINTLAHKIKKMLCSGKQILVLAQSNISEVNRINDFFL